MVRVEEEIIKIQKFFNQCPQCGRENEIPSKYSADVICQICKNLNKAREREARIAKYRKMFDCLNKHLPNVFEFDEHASFAQNSCILEDEFELQSENGIRFIFTIYEDDGVQFFELSRIIGAKDAEDSSVNGITGKR